MTCHGHAQAASSVPVDSGFARFLFGFKEPATNWLSDRNPGQRGCGVPARDLSQRRRGGAANKVHGRAAKNAARRAEAHTSALAVAVRSNMSPKAFRPAPNPILEYLVEPGDDCLRAHDAGRQLVVRNLVRQFVNDHVRPLLGNPQPAAVIAANLAGYVPRVTCGQPR